METVPSPSPLCRFRCHHHRKRGEKLFKFLRGNRTPGSSHFLARCVSKRTVSGHADNSKNRAAADPHTRRPNNNPQDAQQPQEQQQLNPTTNYFLLPVPSRDGGTAATPRGTLPTLSGILRRASRCDWDRSNEDTGETHADADTHASTASPESSRCSATVAAWPRNGAGKLPLSRRRRLALRSLALKRNFAPPSIR
jgi:hypothetical protein